jgi:hypothetical protein
MNFLQVVVNQLPVVVVVDLEGTLDLLYMSFAETDIPSLQHGCDGNQNKFATRKLLDGGLSQLINHCVCCFGLERRHMLLAGVLGMRILDRFRKLMRGFKTIESFKRDCPHTSFLMIEHDCVKTLAMNFCTMSIAA